LRAEPTLEILSYCDTMPPYRNLLFTEFRCVSTRGTGRQETARFCPASPAKPGSRALTGRLCPNRPTMNPLSLRILRLFGEMGADQLDLHLLFEAAGNDPSERRSVLDAINELTGEGLLDSCGGDFYKLTEPGKARARDLR